MHQTGVKRLTIRKDFDKVSFHTLTSEVSRWQLRHANAMEVNNRLG
jgi:hypothetical protein